MKGLAAASVCLFLVLAAPLRADDALFDDMGGQPGINKLVDASVDNYLADPRIKDVFSESNMDRIRAELKDQFCVVAGGPCRYTGHSWKPPTRDCISPTPTSMPWSKICSRRWIPVTSPLRPRTAFWRAWHPCSIRW